MIEKQLKELINTLGLTNELLTTLVAFKVQEKDVVRSEIPATAVSPQAQAAPAQAPPVAATPMQQQTVGQAAPPAAAPSTPSAAAPAAAVSPSKVCIALQEQAMYANHKLNNPMFSMSLLGRYQKTSFGMLTPEELQDAAQFIEQCLVEAGQ